MNHFDYLPTKSDWGFWFEISKSCKVVDSKDDTFTVISPNTLRYLMIVARQLFLSPRPHDRELIMELIETDGLLTVSEMDNITGAESPISRDRIVSSHLKEISTNVGYIDVYQAKEWEKKYKVKITGPDGLHGSTALYQITPKGVIAYECGLNIPYLSLSTFGLRKSASPSDFFVSYGILARKNRFRWTREYMYHHGFFIGAYQNEIIDGVKKYLGKKSDLFLNLSSPQLLLLREYYNLTKYADLLEKSNSRDNNSVDLESQSLDDTAKKYASITESNVTRSRTLLIAYIKNNIDGFILPEWKKLGFSKNDLLNHLPPRDITI